MMRLNKKEDEPRHQDQPHAGDNVWQREDPVLTYTPFSAHVLRSFVFHRTVVISCAGRKYRSAGKKRLTW
jgi:hypothetical protein